MKKLQYIIIFFSFCIFSPNVTYSQNERNQSDEYVFLESRKSFRTHLIKKMLPPDDQKSLRPPPKVQEIYYYSDNLKLKAWLCIPDKKKEEMPAIVYFHGGFSLKTSELKKCKPFIDAGFIVMQPMLRGENGNPGNFELFMGEINDARSAVKWLSQQPFIDKNKIYTFGHSIGGGISDMLSLFEDIPAVHGGSCSSLYTEKSLFRMKERPGIPFDVNNDMERKLRLLIGNVKFMKKQHYAFLGESEMKEKGNIVREETTGQKSKLTIIGVKGDHFTSLPPAIEKYIKIIKSEWN